MGEDFPMFPDMTDEERLLLRKNMAAGAYPFANKPPPQVSRMTIQEGSQPPIAHDFLGGQLARMSAPGMPTLNDVSPASVNQYQGQAATQSGAPMSAASFLFHGGNPYGMPTIGGRTANVNPGELAAHMAEKADVGSFLGAGPDGDPAEYAAALKSMSERRRMSGEALNNILMQGGQTVQTGMREQGETNRRRMMEGGMDERQKALLQHQLDMETGAPAIQRFIAQSVAADVASGKIQASAAPARIKSMFNEIQTAPINSPGGKPGPTAAELEDEERKKVQDTDIAQLLLASGATQASEKGTIPTGAFDREKFLQALIANPKFAARPGELMKKLQASSIPGGMQEVKNALVYGTGRRLREASGGGTPLQSGGVAFQPVDGGYMVNGQFYPSSVTTAGQNSFRDFHPTMLAGTKMKYRNEAEALSPLLNAFLAQQ